MSSWPLWPGSGHFRCRRALRLVTMDCVVHSHFCRPSTMTSTFIRSLALGVRQLVVPGACMVCRRPLLPEQEDFCTSCRSVILCDPHQTCTRCSSTVGPFADLSDGCGFCRKEAFAFERAV